jgi:hypothetical protein
LGASVQSGFERRKILGCEGGPQFCSRLIERVHEDPACHEDEFDDEELLPVRLAVVTVFKLVINAFMSDCWL